MKYINKQKFLNELGKLLTFMREEDRQKALALYSSIFDEAGDEFAVIRLLGSPTRQAVLIARAYNAQTGKLQSYSQPQDSTDESMNAELPPFVKVIEDIRAEAKKLSIGAADFNRIFPPAETETAAAVEVSEAKQLPTDKAERIDAFFRDYTSVEAVQTDAKKTENAEVTADPMASPAGEQDAEAKARVGLLIVYILIAAPLTLIGIAVLLVPALLALLAAAGMICLGVTVFGAAFGGFGVLADKLVVIGAGIALFALGLLLLWIFIWFLGGAVAGLVRGVFRLGRKCCHREVPEQ